MAQSSHKTLQNLVESQKSGNSANRDQLHINAYAYFTTLWIIAYETNSTHNTVLTEMFLVNKYYMWGFFLNTLIRKYLFCLKSSQKVFVPGKKQYAEKGN